MYTVSLMQDRAGHFETVDTADCFEDAIASAKCHVDGAPNTSVYVFCDQTFNGRTYPYLVAKVSCVRLYNGGTDIVVGMA